MIEAIDFHLFYNYTLDLYITFLDPQRHFTEKTKYQAKEFSTGQIEQQSVKGEKRSET